MTYSLTCGHQIAHQDQPHDCDHLRLNELLHLQPTPEQLRHPDEHLFVIVHQSSKIWFKQILFKLLRCTDDFDADTIGLAIWIVRRINRSAAPLPPMLQLLDMTAPSDFFTFRPYRSLASGAESRQLRELELVVGVRDTAYRDRPEAVCGTGAVTELWTERLNTLWNSRSLRAARHDLFERRDLTPDRIYVVAPRANPNAESFLLVEALLDFDEAMLLWRGMHVRSAERAIGPERAGTSGSAGVSYLEAGSTAHRFFPALWQLCPRLWERQGDFAHQPPDEPRHAVPASAAMPLAGHRS